MLERRVVVGKEPLVRRHADDHAAAGPQDASHLGHCTGIVFYMLEDIRGDDHVERPIPEWQPDPVGAAIGASTPGLRQTNGVRVRLHPGD